MDQHQGNMSTSIITTNSCTLPTVVVASEKEDEIILLTPTELNPVPLLPIALCIDNEEQLVALLKTDPFLPKNNYADEPTLF
jgi:hypothetical protein